MCCGVGQSAIAHSVVVPYPLVQTFTVLTSPQLTEELARLNPEVVRYKEIPNHLNNGWQLFETQEKTTVLGCLPVKTRVECRQNVEPQLWQLVLDCTAGRVHIHKVRSFLDVSNQHGRSATLVTEDATVTAPHSLLGTATKRAHANMKVAMSRYAEVAQRVVNGDSGSTAQTAGS